jgi:hypothetical protein
MAKMFYTIEEVAQKLSKSVDEIKQMAKSGQIQEFRDRDKLMFKVDQIDLLAGSDEESGDVHLELDDVSGGSSVIGLTGSGLDLKEESALGLADSREGSGISVFDTDHGGESGTGSRAGTGGDEESGVGSAIGIAASGETQVGGETVDEELSLEAVGSGSGLLDLTRESDDTSLGAELLEEVYSGEENIEIPANASGLFEATAPEASGDELRRAPVAAMPMMYESYDGSGSGLGGGLLIGALAAMVCVAIVVFVGINGATPKLATMFASSSGSLYIWTGGLLAVTIVCGLVGLFLGKASE